MADSFWTGGPDAYSDGLRVEYEAARAQLQQRLGSCQNFAEQTELEAELATLKAEYRRRQQDMGRMLF